MRILHIYDHTEPLQSGYVLRSRTLRKAIEGNGHICNVLSGVRQHTNDIKGYSGGDDINEEQYHRTKPHNVKIPILREIFDIYSLSKSINKLLNKKKYDIVHIHSPLLNGYAALLFGFKKGVKYVYEIRAFWEDAAVSAGKINQNSLYYKFLQWLEVKLCHKMHHIYTICNGLKDDLVSRGVNQEKITIIPNVVDKNKFLNQTPIEVIHKFSSSDKVLGFIGSFYDYEGIDKLIPIAEQLININKNYKFLLVGGGEVEKEIKIKVGKSASKDNFVITGRAPHDHIKSYYDLCNAMIYPRKKSRLTDTTTPLKPLEAMLLHKLVFLTDISGHKEIAKDKQTAIFLETDLPPIKTAELIHTSLENKELTDKIKNQAYDMVVSERSADYVAKKYYINLS